MQTRLHCVPWHCTQCKRLCIYPVYGIPLNHADVAWLQLWMFCLRLCCWNSAVLLWCWVTCFTFSMAVPTTASSGLLATLQGCAGWWWPLTLHPSSRRSQDKKNCRLCPCLLAVYNGCFSVKGADVMICIWAETKTCLLAVHRGFYYPVVQGL